MAVRSPAYGLAGKLDGVRGPGIGPTVATIGGGAAVAPPWGGGGPPQAASRIRQPTTVVRAVRAIDLQTEDINRASGGGVALDVLHRADDTESRIWIVRGNVGKCHSTHPAANPRVNRDVLPAIGAQIGNRIGHDPRIDV